MTGMTSTIYASQGMKRFVGGTVTDVNGKDITGATFTVALGTDANVPPSTGWTAPDVNTIGASIASRKLLMLITSAVSAGTYYVWTKIVDSPEIEPVQLQGPFTVA